MLLSFSEILYFVENLRIRKMGVYLIDRTMLWMYTIRTLGWLVTKCCLSAFWASPFSVSDLCIWEVFEMLPLQCCLSAFWASPFVLDL
jgi:hypothetical protein